MTRRRWSLMAVCVVAMALFGRGAAAADKPNILYIFADDMCYEMVGAYGMTDVTTPHLDKLVADGTTFTHTYNMGSWSGAVCVASRTMLNTGRFIWRANKLNVGAEVKAGRFWSEQMKKAGYETYFTGKWHVRANTSEVFDHAAHTRGGMPNQTKTRYNRKFEEGKPDTWSPYDPKFEGFWKGGKHWSEVVADDAEEFLAKAAKSDKPFFMYLAFNAVHDPRQAPKSYIDKYPLSRMKLPKNFMPMYRPKEHFKTTFSEGEPKTIGKMLGAMGSPPGLRDERLAPFPRTKYSILVNRQEYYAIAEHMDVQIGRILAALEKTGKAKNTYIFFTADHGLAVGRHGLVGKQNLYDHSVRVPFMVVGPGVAKGKKDATKIYLQDAMATSLELAGAPDRDYVDFKSLKPILDGKASTPYDAIYGGYLSVARSVIWKGHKLLLYPKLKVAKLFDMKADPLEIKDLAADPSKKALMKELFGKLLELQKQMGDKVKLSETYKGLAG
jgi:arylsulfatase A-like enzyme